MRKNVTRAAVGVAAVATLAMAPAPALAANAHRAPHRGDLVSVTDLAHLDQQQTADYFKAAPSLGSPPPRNGVDVYAVTYDTVTAQGGPTTASGVLVLPRTDQHDLRVVAFEHGTLAAKNEAPSVDGTTRPDRARTMMFAAAGYAAVAPDYVGLGTGPGAHPYTHAPTEASASVDLLRAARTATEQQHRELDREVMVTGFSQGGHATMAFGKALQAGADRYFRLGALAPVSGPYDVQGAEMPGGLDGHLDPVEATYVFAYWLTSMNRIHHLYDSPSEVFNAPYDKTTEGLFDGYHNDQQIVAGLPGTPQQLLTPRFLAEARHPTGALLQAMRESDATCTGWTPQVPVRLYMAHGDKTVDPENAYHCEADLRSAGTDVSLVDEGGVSHTDSVHMALPAILQWFETLEPVK